jgi:DNA-binding NarL/FixJ family response regulator
MTVPARLLLADDEETFRNSVAVLLRREGYVCDVASNVDEAIDRLNANAYDLLITDLRMPGNMDLELLKAASASDGSLPIIVVTAYPSVPTAIEAVRCAVVDYLVKPFDFDQLVRAVRQALKAWSAARMLESSLGPRGTGARSHRSPGGRRRPERACVRLADAPRAGDRVRPLDRAAGRGDRRAPGVSEHTVRNHLKAVYRKLDVHSQVELPRWRTQAPARV